MKIRLTENKLRQIVAESVRKILKETSVSFKKVNVYDRNCRLRHGKHLFPLLVF